jgi:hypothetical protein
MDLKSRKHERAVASEIAHEIHRVMGPILPEMLAEKNDVVCGIFADALSERDLHFNDLRGTAATKFYIAGFTMREIAETLAWEEESVEKIIRRYVGRSAAIKARIRKLEARE